jgi:hypothetical protein
VQSVQLTMTMKEITDECKRVLKVPAGRVCIALLDKEPLQFEKTVQQCGIKDNTQLGVV